MFLLGRTSWATSWKLRWKNLLLEASVTALTPDWGSPQGCKLIVTAKQVRGESKERRKDRSTHDDLHAATDDFGHSKQTLSVKVSQAWNWMNIPSHESYIYRYMYIYIYIYIYIYVNIYIYMFAMIFSDSWILTVDRHASGPGMTPKVQVHPAMDRGKLRWRPGALVKTWAFQMVNVMLKVNLLDAWWDFSVQQNLISVQQKLIFVQFIGCLMGFFEKTMRFLQICPWTTVWQRVEAKA